MTNSWPPLTFLPYPSFTFHKTPLRSLLNHGVFINTLLQQPFLDCLLHALLYHGGAPQHPQLSTAHISGMWGDRGTQTSQTLSFTVAATFHGLTGSPHHPHQCQTDAHLHPEHCPHPFPSPWKRDPREQTWTVWEMLKVHISSFILLPVDGMDIPCYLEQLSTSARLLSKQHSRNEHF